MKIRHLPALLILLVLLPTLMLSGEESESEPLPIEPLPSLMPRLRDALSIPSAHDADPRPTPEVRELRPVDRIGLVADLNALRQDIARVRRLFEEEDPEILDRALAYQRQEEEDSLSYDHEDMRREGDPLRSTRLGSHLLEIQRWRRGEESMPATVTAAIDQERVEVIYRDLMFHLGRSINDRSVTPARRMASLHVEDMPWDQALTRLLRQVGLDWRQERSGASSGQIIIYEAGGSEDQRQPEEWQERALYALRAAARSGNDAVAAQARYLMARNDQRLAEERQQRRNADTQSWRSLHYTAINGFADIIHEFDTGTQAQAQSLPWVRRAMLGIARSMEAVDMHREAYSVYRNYLAQADRQDPERPRVMLAAAHAARRQHQRAVSGDRSDIDIAISLLRDILNIYGEHPDHLAVSTEARLELGRLYFQVGEYAAARRELLAHATVSGAEISHQIQFMLAQSDIALGKQYQAGGDPRSRQADLYFANAQARLETLTQALHQHSTDPLLDPGLYKQAIYELGSVKMLRREPDFVAALHIFLRARQRFPQSELEGRLLVHIARCYAEIHADQQHIEHMWQIIGNDQLLDNRDVAFQLDEMLQDLQLQVQAYPGSVQSRVHFYLAQYHFRMGEQNPRAHAEHFERAVSLYQRVIDAQPPQHLAQAARLGLARAALAAGDDVRGRQNLVHILQAPGVHERDRRLAAQILGDHYYQRGMFREAIEAYDGRYRQ